MEPGQCLLMGPIVIGDPSTARAPTPEGEGGWGRSTLISLTMLESAAYPPYD